MLDIISYVSLLIQSEYLYTEHGHKLRF